MLAERNNKSNEAPPRTVRRGQPFSEIIKQELNNRQSRRAVLTGCAACEELVNNR